MSKRMLEETRPSTGQKRRKLVPAEGTGITSVHHLQRLVAFRQDAAPDMRAGIAAFKTFLESILYDKEGDTLSLESLLKDFLVAECPDFDVASDRACLPGVMQIWRYAAQSHNDTLLSAVPAVLALLLKTVSSLIEFRELGLRLGKTILQHDQLKLLARGLSGPKHKEHIISPCVRLLTEIVSFDGGVLARQVLSAKSFTFDSKTIARNISLYRPTSDTNDSGHHPSVRSNSIRYVLAHLRFQPAAQKIEILNNSNVFRALFDRAKYDSHEQLQHTLDALKTHVLADDAVPRSSKRYLLNDHNLSSIASIYRQATDAPDRPSPTKRSDTIAHEFLSYVCTSDMAGVLRQFSSYYPPGADHSGDDFDGNDDHAGFDIGLDSVEWYGKYNGKVPVQNGVLSKFLQTLRPYASTYDCELILAIFRSAPELVADYFFNKASFAFDPKLTATWIGYCTFLFSVIKLPVPAFFGRQAGYDLVPPPVSLLIESILPQPLTQKVLTRCLNQQHDLITFFAIQIMILAFQKLQECLVKFEEAALVRGEMWKEGTQRLREAFAQRCPSFKDVISAFRRTKEDNMLQREASLHLLSLYYTTSPSLVSGETFDVAVALDNALHSFATKGPEHCNGSHPSQDSSKGTLLSELDHLLQIASHNTSLRWWHKPESRRYSPFTTLLKIVATTKRDKISEAMWRLLESVIQENDILQRSTMTSATEGLLASLMPTSQWVLVEELFEWLDDLFGRNIRKPIRYLDDLGAFESSDDMSGISPVWMTIVEQWPFAASRNTSALHIAEWLSRYLEASRQIGEDEAVLSKIRSSLIAAAASVEKLCDKLEQRRERDIGEVLELIRQTSIPSPYQSDDAKGAVEAHISLSADYFRAPDELEDLSGVLHRPMQLDIHEAIDTGAVGSLILCLSSADADIRNQALTNLQVLTKRMSAPQIQSSYTPSKQLYLLLGTITNTASQRFGAATSHAPSSDQVGDEDRRPMPYTISAFGSMAIAILASPGHPLYDKINRFLLRGPTWDPARLPTYWVQSLLRSSPVEISISPKTNVQPASSSQTAGRMHDPVARFSATPHPLATLPVIEPFPQNAYHTGVNFLISYMYHALRTPSDMAILRRRSTFEPLLALISDPFLPSAIKDVVLGFIWRATFVSGGSTTLITRTGVTAWLQGMLSGGNIEQGLLSKYALQALALRIWESCDKERVEEWSGSTMLGVVERLVQKA